VTASLTSPVRASPSTVPADIGGFRRNLAAAEEVHMVDNEHLRPVERRVLRWAHAGVGDAEIGHRFRRSERWAAQVRFLAGLDRRGGSAARLDPLRPLERRVLRWREQGEDLVDLSDRFLRSPDHLARVEEYARYKLALH
jgi:hypothetical protein